MDSLVVSVEEGKQVVDENKPTIEMDDVGDEAAHVEEVVIETPEPLLASSSHITTRDDYTQKLKEDMKEEMTKHLKEEIEKIKIILKEKEKPKKKKTVAKKPKKRTEDIVIAKRRLVDEEEEEEIPVKRRIVIKRPKLKTFEQEEDYEDPRFIPQYSLYRPKLPPQRYR